MRLSHVGVREFLNPCTTSVGEILMRNLLLDSWGAPLGGPLSLFETRGPFRAATPGVQKHFIVRMFFSVRPSVPKHTYQTSCRQNVWRHNAGRMFVGVIMFVVPPDGARWRAVLAAGMQVHRGSPHPPLRPHQTQNA